jgi:hypothetical protein
MPVGREPDVWHSSSMQRVGAAIVTAGGLALAVGVTAGGGVAPGVAALLWVFAVTLALGAWRILFVPYVALQSTQVVVQNRIGRTAIPYSEIVAVRAGYYGIRITKRDRGEVLAWAVQKPNWATWSHKRTRADDLVGAIVARTQSPHASS